MTGRSCPDLVAKARERELPRHTQRLRLSRFPQLPRAALRPCEAGPAFPPALQTSSPPALQTSSPPALQPSSPPALHEESNAPGLSKRVRSRHVRSRQGLWTAMHTGHWTVEARLSLPAGPPGRSSQCFPTAAPPKRVDALNCPGRVTERASNEWPGGWAPGARSKARCAPPSEQHKKDVPAKARPGGSPCSTGSILFTVVHRVFHRSA